MTKQGTPQKVLKIFRVGAEKLGTVRQPETHIFFFILAHTLLILKFLTSPFDYIDMCLENMK